MDLPQINKINGNPKNILDTYSNQLKSDMLDIIKKNIIEKNNRIELLTKYRMILMLRNTYNQCTTITHNNILMYKMIASNISNDVNDIIIFIKKKIYDISYIRKNKCIILDIFRYINLKNRFILDKENEKKIKMELEKICKIFNNNIYVNINNIKLILNKCHTSYKSYCTIKNNILDGNISYYMKFIKEFNNIVNNKELAKLYNGDYQEILNIIDIYEYNLMNYETIYFRNADEIYSKIIDHITLFIKNNYEQINKIYRIDKYDYTSYKYCFYEVNGNILINRSSINKLKHKIINSIDLLSLEYKELINEIICQIIDLNQFIETDHDQLKLYFNHILKHNQYIVFFLFNKVIDENCLI